MKNNYVKNINTFTYYSEAIVMHDSIWDLRENAFLS